MAQVRAQYESDKAAAQKRQTSAKDGQDRHDQDNQDKPRLPRRRSRPLRKKSTQTANDDIPYKPRNSTRTRVDDGDSSGVGAFAAGALLGTAVGVAIGKH